MNVLGGHVKLVDVMGNDMSIVDAARVSFLGSSKGEEADKKLLFYLMRNKHTTPFEMVEFKFHVKCPLFVARQWMRHRTWSYNEVSRRYTDESLDFYIPTEWRGQSSDDRQASEGIAISMTQELEDVTCTCLSYYNKAIESGISREMARMFLPQNMYTEFIGKTDAHNLMHFLRLRLSSHAQFEIRQYAIAIMSFFEKALPWTFEAFKQELDNDPSYNIV